MAKSLEKIFVIKCEPPCGIMIASASHTNLPDIDTGVSRCIWYIYDSEGSKNQRFFGGISCLTPKMFDFLFVVISQIVEAETVLLWIHQGAERRLKTSALGCVQEALKYRALDSLTVVDALPGDLSQAFFPGSGFRVYIIGDQNQHKSLISIKKVDIRPDLPGDSGPEAAPESKEQAPRKSFPPNRGE